MTPTPADTPQAPRPYLVQLWIEDSAGHRVQALGSAWSQVAGPDLLLSSRQLQADGQAAIEIRDALGELLGRWDGAHADGGLVAPGAYRIRALWTENGAEKNKSDVAVAVLPAQNALLKSLVVAPNPAGRLGSEQVALRWVPDGKTDRVRGRIYNLAGELVSLGEAPAQDRRLSWGLRSPAGEAVSGGVYVWQTDAVDSAGRVLERRVLKFVVVR